MSLKTNSKAVGEGVLNDGQLRTVGTRGMWAKASWTLRLASRTVAAGSSTRGMRIRPKGRNRDENSSEKNWHIRMRHEGGGGGKEL